MPTAPVAAGNGTQTATIGTEHTLLDISAAGVFTLHVNLLNLAAGDIVELRVYQIILTGDTREVAYFESFADVQPTDGRIAISTEVGNELTDSGSLRFTLKQTVGTGRAFKWKVLQY